MEPRKREFTQPHQLTKRVDITRHVWGVMHVHVHVHVQVYMQHRWLALVLHSPTAW